MSHCNMRDGGRHMLAIVKKRNNTSIEALQAAEKSELASVSGIGENLAGKIKETVQELLQKDSEGGDFIGGKK